MGRIIWGGIVGGVIVFVWGFVIHVMTPLGHMGISPLPDVDGVKAAFSAADVETGMYMIPHAYPGDTEEQQARWKEEYTAGPRALIIYTPEGDDPTSPMQMGMSLLTNIAAALIAALIVSQVAAFYGARLLVVAMLGLFAWLTVDVPYWNWFLFPTDRIAASCIEHVGGWFVAGLAMAGIVKGRLR